MKLVLPGLLILGLYGLCWRNPPVNLQSQKSIYESILESEHKQELEVSSMGSKFLVEYVANTQLNCLNPYFPAISIVTLSKHTAWLHIVSTDSSDLKWQRFIDSAPGCHPFYNIEANFLDAPHWSYTLINRPISFWIGHAYAVDVDEQNRIVHCRGGIRWGYRLSPWHLRPLVIIPSELTEYNWQSDKKLFHLELPDYVFA